MSVSPFASNVVRTLVSERVQRTSGCDEVNESLNVAAAGTAPTRAHGFLLCEPVAFRGANDGRRASVIACEPPSTTLSPAVAIRTLLPGPSATAAPCANGDIPAGGSGSAVQVGLPEALFPAPGNMIVVI